MLLYFSSVWKILPTRIRKSHQVVLGINIGLSQEISNWCIIQIIIVFQAQSFQKILVRYILRDWYICWDTLGTIKLWAWNNMLILMMHQWLISWDKPILRPRTTWWIFLIIVGKIVQTLVEVQEQKLSFIKVGWLAMAHMFQDQLLNKVQKVSTMQHALQEWL